MPRKSPKNADVAGDARMPQIYDFVKKVLLYYHAMKTRLKHAHAHDTRPPMILSAFRRRIRRGEGIPLYTMEKHTIDSWLDCKQ